MFNLTDMSAQYAKGNADADLRLKQAEQMKVMQEVYDLSVNNEAQKVHFAEQVSPEAREMRSAERKSKTAQSEASMWESWNTVRDAKHEQVESSFAAYNMQPGQESYALARKGILSANPQLAGVLPAEHSKEAGEMLRAVQRSWLNNRQFKQKMAAMGYSAQLQEAMNAKKYGHDLEMQGRDISGKIQMMREDWDRRDWNTQYQEEGANKRTRMQLESGLQIAERFQQEGRPDLAMRQLQIVQEQENLLRMAKASGGRDPLLQEKDRQKIAKDTYEQTKTLLTDDYTHDAVGIDKDMDIFKARGMSDVTTSLQQHAEALGVPSDKAPGWIKERMVLDPTANEWVQLPLQTDPNKPDYGNPIGGYTSNNIRGLIGKEVDSSIGAEFGRSGYTGSITTTDKVSNLAEAIAVYKGIMKGKHGIDITKPNNPLLTY